jgi:hypothetical protein
MSLYRDHRGNVVSEPPCFGTETVVAYLREVGKPRFAAFVQRLGEDSKTANVREKRLIDRINELVMKYEPPPPISDGPVWTGD